MSLQQRNNLTAGNAAPERIYEWQHTQMSIARHYGGINYNGYSYLIAFEEPGTPLVRADVLWRYKKHKKCELSKNISKKIIEQQGVLL